jgi:ferritin-like metal-binding protein YciE
MAEELRNQLTRYLEDAHSIEVQALAQLRAAPDIAGDPKLAAAFREHETETETTSGPSRASSTSGARCRRR